MKKLLYTFLLLGLFLSFQSCNDFLELKPVSSSTSGNAFETQDDIEAALVGAYSTLHVEYYIWDNILLSDVRSDNAYAGPPDDVDIFEYDLLTVSSSNNRLVWNWGDLYNGIARCNTILNKIDAIKDIPGERASEIKGEARFLRALFYFDLVKMFGGVPLITSTESSEPDKIQVPRSTLKESYDFIVEDLEFASQNLPDTYGDDNSVNKARATKGAADALLAKVWAQRPDRDYSKVLKYCDDVINSPAGYALLSDFNELFDGTNYNNEESIFEIQFIAGTDQGNWGPQLFLPPSISGDGWRKYATPSHNLVDAYFDAQDWVRLDATIMWEWVDWVDEYWNAEDPNEWVTFAYKFKHADDWSSGDHIYLIRLADIMLLKAEALANLNQGDLGRDIVNTIRARVGLDPVPAGNSQEMLDIILNERRLELAYEAQRWDDLVRYGKAVSTMSSLQEKNLITGEFVDYNANENTLILPIPIDELDRNPNLVQNPGY